MVEGGGARKGHPTPHDRWNYPHYVLDEWFEYVARPRLKGRCQLVRYADDAVIAFEDHLSGKRLLDVLEKRLGRKTCMIAVSNLDVRSPIWAY
jgi:hypothetical protein